jgi:signal transduction histidine kinase
MTDLDLVARLAAHRMLGSAPREQLAWLASHGTLRRFEVGEQVSAMGEPLQALYVVLSGHVIIRVDRGAGPRKVMEWHGGDVSGLLPYSRLTVPPGRVTVEEPTEILMVGRECFPEMISRCHEVTAILVHAMLDRARRFTKSDFHDEKMVSLGRLSAGLAHELNNPASALARSAQELSARLFELEASALALGAARLTPEQLAAIGRVRTQCGNPGARAALSPLERAEREEAVAEWLARKGMPGDIAEALAETAVTVGHLDRLAEALDRDALGFALRSIGASCRTRLLASETQTAAARIHSLVAAIKGFTYMDQSSVPAPVSIGQGLSDTLAVLGGKARRKSVTVTLRIPEDLPPVEGFGGELNQVWANLIDNAIDAAPESGQVEVTAACRDDAVVVRVVDDGPGIPEGQKERIFEPFFTTKPQGQGTGLGLDIAVRLVRQHEGQIEVDSRPGRTEFRVILPRA